MNRRTQAVALALALFLLAAGTATATTVTVQNTGPGHNVIVNVATGSYTGGVYAGVENLLVDGTHYNGFCIDLYHFSSSSPLSYTVDSLSASPIATPPGPGPMGTDRANFIREMWAQYYATAVLTDAGAAAFQLAIWGVLQGSVTNGVATANWSFLSDASVAQSLGATGLIDWANTHTGALADVAALNPVNGTNQTYAIGVPDGGATLMLLGGALVGLGALRRKFRA